MRNLKLASFIILISLSNIYPQWTLLNSGTSNYLSQVFFVNHDIGFVVGEHSTIQKTTDAGTTWSNSNTGVTTNLILSSIFFLSDMVGCVVGYDVTAYHSKVFRTTNGGNSWYEISISAMVEANYITFINNNIGFICGDGAIFKTTDGGVTWSPLNIGITNLIYSVYFSDVNNGYACGTSGSFIKTTNGGVTWTSKPLIYSSALNRVQFINNTIGYIAGHDDFFKTTNGGETWLSVKPANIDFEALFFTDSNNGFTGGWQGQVYRTTNGGVSWISEPAPTINGYIRSLFFFTSTYGYACGDYGNICRYIIKELTLSSPIGGESWLPGSYYNITWTSSNINQVAIQYSTDGGSSWTSIITSYSATSGSFSWLIPYTISNNCRIKILDADDSKTFNISNNFKIVPTITVSSPNGGEQWVGGLAKDIKWQSQKVSNINISYSTNGGTNWLLIAASISADLGSYTWTVPNTFSTQCRVKIVDSDHPTNLDISDQSFSIIPVPSITIYSPHGGEQWDVGLTYNIYYSTQSIQYIKIEYSTNLGTDWHLIIDNYASTSSYNWLVPNIPSKYCKIKISDKADQNVFIISDSTFEILPVYWSPQNSKVYLSLKDVKFLDFNTGYICGASGNFLKTTNSGLDWSVISTGITTNLNAIYFVNTNLGWAAGENGLTIKTTNAGLSWTYQNSNTTQSLSSLFFKSELIGWIVGKNGIILKTTDGGTNWNSQTSGITNALNKIFFYSVYDGWIVGASGTYLKTTNGGTNWSRQTIGASSDFNSVYFSNNLNGSIVANGGTILISSDGGYIWSDHSPHVNGNLYSVYFPTQEIGYSSGANGLILKTTDGGISWYRLGTGITTQINCLYFIDNNNGYAIGENGMILNTKNGGTTLIEEQSSSLQPKSYTLAQNYPNPFNPSTVISYSLLASSYVRLIAYNTLGQTVRVLENGYRNAGSYSVTFNAAELPSGIYFYKIEAGKYTQVKKMMLVK